MFRYDFNNDGLISREDVRIVLSYIPFKKGSMSDVSGSNKGTPSSSNREGLYKDGENTTEYKERMDQQGEIKNFMDQVFGTKKELNFEDFLNINKNISSEMFYSLMAILHEKLPCSQNVFRLKKMYRMRIQTQIGKSQSPARSIASPGLIRGLSKLGSKDCLSPLNIKNKKGLGISPRMSSGKSSAIQSELADELFEEEDLMK